MKVLKRIFYTVSIVTIVLCFWGCGMFRTSHSALKRKVKKIEETETVYVSLKSGHSIRTVVTNRSQTDKPVLVFVHGAPGDVTGFLDYHKDSILQSKYRIVSYDRPGYGYKDGYKELNSFTDQAAVLNEVLDSLQMDSVTLFAHSFGGAIALECAINHPTKVKSMILAAVAVDPENEKFFWFGNLGKWKATKWMLPKQIRISGEEKYSHVEELEKLAPKLNLVTQKVIVVHGKEDSLVPFVNLAYLENKLTSADLSLYPVEKANHFIVWKQIDFFRALLLK